MVFSAALLSYALLVSVKINLEVVGRGGNNFEDRKVISCLLADLLGNDWSRNCYRIRTELSVFTIS